MACLVVFLDRIREVHEVNAYLNNHTKSYQFIHPSKQNE